MECPKCNDIEKIEFLTKCYFDSFIEFQLICRNCGNLFKDHLDYDELK